MNVFFSLNSEGIQWDGAHDRNLLSILRDDFGLMQSRYGCGEGICSACLVLLDGNPTPSCRVPAFLLDGREVVTFEGFAKTKEYAWLQESLAKRGVRPCALCRNGIFLTLHAAIKNPQPSALASFQEYLPSIVCLCTSPSVLSAALPVLLDGGETVRKPDGRVVKS